MYCDTCKKDVLPEVIEGEGNTVCTECGSVLEESAIVSEVTFGETSGGSAMVQGKYVGMDQTRTRALGGAYRQRGSQESREQTLANSKRVGQQLGSLLNLPEYIVEEGQRFFTMALNFNFVQGRRTDYVVSACLYCACRTEKVPHMLIDFSDSLRINVFVLGATYLKLMRELDLKLPTVDPSLYVSRFASMLDFRDETSTVATEATRIVKRFRQDWMHVGRRPAALCGAALFLAARMNNFRRSLEEIMQVVKIGDGTLRKRLDEFRSTASGQLTVQDFRDVWLQEESDPPAFAKAHNEDGTGPSRLLEFEDLSAAEELFASRMNDDGDDSGARNAILEDPNLNLAIESEIRSFLDTETSRDISSRVDREQQLRIEKARSETNLNDPDIVDVDAAKLEILDEDEIDDFILTEEEIEAKSRLWLEMNHDYLQALADRHVGPDGTLRRIPPRRPRKRNRPRDAENPTGATPGEAVKTALQKKRFSSKLDYSALQSLFESSPSDGPRVEVIPAESRNNDDAQEGHFPSKPAVHFESQTGPAPDASSKSADTVAPQEASSSQSGTAATQPAETAAGASPRKSIAPPSKRQSISSKSTLASRAKPTKAPTALGIASRLQHKAKHGPTIRQPAAPRKEQPTTTPQSQPPDYEDSVVTSGVLGHSSDPSIEDAIRFSEDDPFSFALRYENS